MTQTYQQTDTNADNGFNVGCSGATAGGTTQAKEATQGGTAGSTEITIDPASNDPRAVMVFQTDTDEPGRTNWHAGNYVVNLEVTTSQMNIQWTETHVCERTTGGTYNPVASLTGQTTDLGTNGVKTHTVVLGADYTAAATSTLYIVLVIDNSTTHGSTDVGITPSQVITTPIRSLTDQTLAATQVGSADIGEKLLLQKLSRLKMGEFHSNHGPYEI